MLSWKREERWNPSESGHLLLDPHGQPPALWDHSGHRGHGVREGRAGVWTVHGYTEDAWASALPSCLSDLAGWQMSLAQSDLMSGGSLVACSGETGVERNWYPAGQPCCSPDAPDWTPRGLRRRRTSRWYWTYKDSP